MSDLIAVVIASLPFIVFGLLVAETFRSRPVASDALPIATIRRSFGA